MAFSSLAVSRRVALLGTIASGPLAWRDVPRQTSKPSTQGRRQYQVLLIADTDTSKLYQREPGQFVSYLTSVLVEELEGGGSGGVCCYQLASMPAQQASDVSSSQAAAVTQLVTGYSFGNRGAELSDMVLLPQPACSLLTFDDRTGIAFEVLAEGHAGQHADELCGVAPWADMQPQEQAAGSFSLIPRWILADGPGNQPRSFKAEWSTMKDGLVYVGSHGYEGWTSGGPFIQGQGIRNLQYIKQIDPATGQISHTDWSHIYNSISAAVGVQPPGYIVHEAAAWSDVHQRWFFMPRRVSFTAWEYESDQLSGANLIISCNEAGGDVKVVQIQGSTHPTRGFSALRFVPGSGDQHIIATKTIERKPGEPCSSYLTVVNIEGQVLLPETLISDTLKYEGLEIFSSSYAL